MTAGDVVGGGTMQPYIVMACVACMCVGAVVAVIGRTLRRVERVRAYAGDDSPGWGLWLLLVGAVLFVPAAVLMVVIVKYF